MCEPCKVKQDRYHPGIENWAIHSLIQQIHESQSHSFELRRSKSGCNVGYTEKVTRVSQDLINRYKKTARLQFQNPETESRYRDTEETRGRSSSAFAFAALLLLCTAYAYLESRAFGHEVAIPMYGYILAAVAAAANLLLSRFSYSVDSRPTSTTISCA